jgi:site-specific DNA-methyltransferase (adenine-specific)
MALIHQIWQGDSVDLCEKFKPGRVDCVITDPPFGVGNLSNMAVTKAGKQYARKIANDESPEVAMRVFDKVMDVLLPRTAEDCDLYIFTAYQVLTEWLTLSDKLSRHSYTRKALLVWEKDGPGMGDLSSWGQGHEFIIYLKKGRREKTAVRRSGVIHVPQIRPGGLIHPHEKPTALLELFIRHSTEKGDFLVDPFGGSGSLVRAAQGCGRSAVAIELDDMNYKLAKQKLEHGEGEGFDL